MSEIANSLACLPLFAGLLREDIQAAAPLWEARSLPAGEPLWWHGDMAEELALVLSGSLQIRINNKVVGTVEAGELVGEAAAWTRGGRTASVHAETMASLAVLPSARLPRLRTQHVAVYDCLLEDALSGLARRVRQVDREIARIAYGDGNAPGRPNQNALGKLWKKLTTTPPRDRPSARQALRSMPAMTAISADALTTIEQALTPRHFPAGTPIFLEGDPGESVFVVASGCIDVIRHVRGGRGERLASLYPGALVGTGSLLLSERRNASCVAAETTACWVFEMNQPAYKGLRAEPGRVWRESILESLRFQIASADAQLVKLKQGGVRPKITDYERIRAGLI